jgi:mitochondrial enoyl-[acyl-carrier protein] reductase / trans-2-enoyl-CoA reductase
LVDYRTTNIFKSKAVPKPQLGLNCVGGKNALEVTRQLANKGVLVTYGGMSREPLTASTAALIFKDLRFVGYWMTRWNKDYQGSAQWSQMYNEITKMILAKKLVPPKHKLVPFSQYKIGIENALSSKGFTGCKFIFDMSK